LNSSLVDFDPIILDWTGGHDMSTLVHTNNFFVEERRPKPTFNRSETHLENALDRWVSVAVAVAVAGVSMASVWPGMNCIL
jgi:hypothetical protein